MALADQAPIVPLCWTGMDQPGKPRQGDRQRSPIAEIHSQGIIRDCDVLSLGEGYLNDQSSHAMPPGVARGFR